MTQWLSDLGRLCAHRAHAVLLSWVATLLAIFGLIAWTGPQLSNDFAIPGTEAQDGLDTLSQRFPEMNGTSGQLLLTSADGEAIDTQRNAIARYLETITPTLPEGTQVTDPWSDFLRSPAVSDDDRHALVNIQFPFSINNIDANARRLLEEAATLAPAGISAQPGGQIYQTTSVPLSLMEVIGVGVAFIALMVTLRRLPAALTPLLTAFFGTAGIVGIIVLMALWADISTTTPTLAVMITLAVGIDYALFIVTRHQRQMRAGLPCHLSIPLATATAGSAVVYAAMTVIIALCALAVTGIPFLTTMGVSAAGGVVIAAISAITALPALLALLGERVLPRRRGTHTRQEDGADNNKDKTRNPTLPQRWAQRVTAHPILALLGVLVTVIALALPAPLLALTLPDNGVEPPGTHARDTYDAVEDAFGPGANAPLLVIGDIIHSTDPLALMEQWATTVEAVPGVASIQLATPNRNADLGILVVIPTTSSTDPATAHTVKALRAHAEQWHDTYGIDAIRVTGLTAAQIDITNRLSAALLPFSIVVVALALVILTLVFHSIWVPLSAAVGYLLSVGAAFGVTAAAFTWEPLNNALLIGQTGAVICFMPIMVIGVLFGLAMDYQVFVVTAIQEEWLKGARPRESIIHGMRHSGNVVTAAAIIMIAVFVGFIPHGSFYVQPIALGLAVGVAVDAFLIRMTAIPALLTLIGEAAWWCPQFLSRYLPHLSHGDEYAGTPWLASSDSPENPPLLLAQGIVISSHATPALPLKDFQIHAGECVRIQATPLLAREVIRILSGITRPRRGHLLTNLTPPGARYSPTRQRTGFIYDTTSADLVVKDIHRKTTLPCLAVDTPLSDEELLRLHEASAGRGGCLILGPLVDPPPGITTRTLTLEVRTHPSQNAARTQEVIP